jgi:CDP-4-dehydro-6-deoxyglucose reductase
MDFEVTIKPAGNKFVVDEHSTVLDAAIQSGLNLPHSCRDGSCGTCMSRLLKGKISQPEDVDGISKDELSQGYILTCVAQPETDLEIESDHFPELDGIRPALYPCKVESIGFPSKDIAVLNLRFPKNTKFIYLAGQYVDLIWNGAKRSYSIANAKKLEQGIELHIRKVANGLFSEFIFGKLKPETLMRIEGPHGTFFIRDNDSPILFLAGGTGFAPVKAMIEELITQKTMRDIHLYWGVQNNDHLYSEVPESWQQKCKNIRFTPVVSEPDKDWKGRQGLVHEAVLEDFDDLSTFEVYACGSLDMINATRSDFFRKGLHEENFYSDAFTPFKQA